VHRIGWYEEKTAVVQRDNQTLFDLSTAKSLQLFHDNKRKRGGGRLSLEQILSEKEVTAPMARLTLMPTILSKALSNTTINYKVRFSSASKREAFARAMFAYWDKAQQLFSENKVEAELDTLLDHTATVTLEAENETVADLTLYQYIQLLEGEMQCPT